MVSSHSGRHRETIVLNSHIGCPVWLIGRLEHSKYNENKNIAYNHTGRNQVELSHSFSQPKILSC